VRAGIPAGFFSQDFFSVRDLAGAFAGLALGAIVADTATQTRRTLLEFFDWHKELRMVTGW
jgi:hypothetical protein